MELAQELYSGNLAVEKFELATFSLHQYVQLACNGPFNMIWILISCNMLDYK